MAIVKRPSTLRERLSPSVIRERLRTDRKARIIAIAMVIVLLVCLIPTPILAYTNTMALAKDGIAHLKNAEADFKALSTSPTNLTTINAAQAELQRAHDDFAQLQLRVALLTPVGFVPKIGPKVAGAEKLAPLAVYATQAGVLACDALKVVVTGLKNPLGTSGGLTSADLSQVTSDVDQIVSLFGQMQPILQGLTQSDLSLDPGLWPTVSGVQAKLPQVTQLVGDLDGLAHALPQLLGVGKPSTYLVLILDSSELRPTGGFIGNFGTLTMDSGRLDSAFHISDITLIDSSVKFTPPQVVYTQTIPIPDKYSWLKTVFAYPWAASWSLRDSNLDPNYATASQYALQLYQTLLPDAQKNLAAQGSSLQLYDPGKSGPFAGVITLSLGFFAQALAITGPIQVNDNSIHETVTSQNFVDKIHYYALNPGAVSGPDSKACGTTSCAKVFTSDVVKAFMAQIKANLSMYLGHLAKLAYDSLRTKDLEVYLVPSSAEQLLQDLNVSSSIQTPKTGDTVFEIDSNIGANKDNYFLNYQMSDQITIDQAGDATHKLNWNYRWQSNFSNPQIVFPAGNPDYHSYSRVFAPANATYISQTGLQGFGVNNPSADTFGLKVFHGAAYALFPYGGSVGPYGYGVSWKVPGVVTHDSAGYHYALLFQREAGIVWPLTVTVTLPTCATLTGAPVVSGTTSAGTVAVKGNVVTITGPLTMNEQYQINWTC